MTGKSTVQPNPHILKMQVRSQDFHWGANFKNWDQFFNCWNDRSCKCRRHKTFRVLQGHTHLSKKKKMKFEILKLLEMHRNCQSSYHHHNVLYQYQALDSFVSVAGNASKLSIILPSPQCFVSIPSTGQFFKASVPTLN